MQKEDKSVFLYSPIIDVYTAVIPKDIKIKEVYPKQRDMEISGVTSKEVKEQKYCAWKLLEYALFKTFGTEITNLEFSKTEYGKWVCNGHYFSISHSHGVVAVALSTKPVGIDVEKFEPPKNDIAKHIFTDSELEEYFLAKDKWQHVITAWSKKESVYKKQGVGNFNPKNISLCENNIETSNISFKGQEYVLSVCADDLKNIRYYHDVQNVL